MKLRATVTGAALGLLLGVAGSAPADLQAQGPDGRWPLQPSTGHNRIIAPFMEGWYENEDGTFSISFGYFNLNDETVEIPLGEDNFIEPAQFDGMQPTYFLNDHHRGVFTVTLPASMRETDVWWTIRNPNGEVTKVPGRTTAGAYQLDWNPRPHGTVPPTVSFEDQDDTGRGPPGLMADEVVTTRVNEPVELAMHVEDTSVREEGDPRFRDALPVNVTWVKHQGPVGGEVEFSRHPDAMDIAEREGGDDDDDDAPRRPAPNRVAVEGGTGWARVMATFTQPGEYIVRGEADTFNAPDSSASDQCCWSNGYIRVNVTE